MSLNDPKAQPLLDQVGKIVGLASQAFRPGAPVGWSEEITELPTLVERLQSYLPPRSRRPVPFWKCVVKLDKEKPSLRLRRTLEAMYTRIAKINPGPLARLMNNECQPPLSEREKQLAQRLGDHLYDKPTEVPKNLEQYATIFARTKSQLGASLLKQFSKRDLQMNESLCASLGFLDLYWAVPFMARPLRKGGHSIV